MNIGTKYIDNYQTKYCETKDCDCLVYTQKFVKKETFVIKKKHLGIYKKFMMNEMKIRMENYTICNYFMHICLLKNDIIDE